jgi:pimeloyl-ACP methyl ester carboxylesterase
MRSPALSLSLLSGLTTVLQATPLKDTKTNYQPHPYTVNVDPSLIELARQKASTFRPTIDTSAPAWFDGPPATDIDAIVKYWVNEYDWPAIQSSINNNFSHFYTTVPAPGGVYSEPVDLHFIHQRSARPDAIPILFLHGWPSTALEWASIIPSLVAPENGSDPAFHVVAPDIPGYGFSPAMNGSRVGVSRTEHAAIFASLMEQLGYDKYAVYSTDVGTGITMALVVDYAERIIQHVTDFYAVFATQEDQARFASNQTSAEETEYIKSLTAFLGTHSGYSSIQSTYPLSLAYAMNDSPAGFMAWVYHLSTTVNDRPVEKEEIITNTLMLWIQGVYSNIRDYKEIFSTSMFTPDKFFTVPTSVLQFGGVGGKTYPELASFNYVVSILPNTVITKADTEKASRLG